jgi:hypothetical protein
MVVCYLVMMIAGPLFAAQAGLPSPAHLTLWAGLGGALTDAARALLVLGLFAAIAAAAGTIGRGQLATTALTAGTMLLALLIASIASLGQLSPASFVQAWMRFGPVGYLPTNFWSRFISTGPSLSPAVGLAGIAVTAIVAAVIANWRFGTDITA